MTLECMIDEETLKTEMLQRPTVLSGREGRRQTVIRSKEFARREGKGDNFSLGTMHKRARAMTTKIVCSETRDPFVTRTAKPSRPRRFVRIVLQEFSGESQIGITSHLFSNLEQ